MRGELYLADLLEPVFKLAPQGQRIISLVQVRGFIVITTDQAVYKVEKDYGGLGFTIHLINGI